MKKFTMFLMISLLSFSKICWSNELNYKVISNYLTEKKL